MKKTKNTKRGNITVKNVLHGLLMTVLGSVFTGLTQALSTGTADFKTIGLGAAGAGLGYIGKKFFENEKGEIINTNDGQ